MYEKCKPLAKIEKSQFVGGGYAKVSEKQMMKDILRNGAISGDMMAGEQFKVYESGILSEKQSKSLVQKMHHKKHKKQAIVAHSLLQTCEADSDFEFKISISEPLVTPVEHLSETK